MLVCAFELGTTTRMGLVKLRRCWCTSLLARGVGTGGSETFKCEKVEAAVTKEAPDEQDDKVADDEDALELRMDSLFPFPFPLVGGSSRQQLRSSLLISAQTAAAVAATRVFELPCLRGGIGGDWMSGGLSKLLESALGRG